MSSPRPDTAWYRVQVTAWSRQRSGWAYHPHPATELAAPAERRTPTGTETLRGFNQTAYGTGDSGATGSESENGMEQKDRTRCACHFLHPNPKAEWPPVRSANAVPRPRLSLGGGNGRLCTNCTPLGRFALDRGRPSHGSRDREGAVVLILPALRARVHENCVGA